MIMAAALQSNWKEELTRRTLHQANNQSESNKDQQHEKKKLTGIKSLDTAPLIEPPVTSKCESMEVAVTSKRAESTNHSKGERVGRLVVHLSKVFPTLLLDDLFTAVLIHCPQGSVTANAIAFLKLKAAQQKHPDLTVSQLHQEELLEYVHREGDYYYRPGVLDENDTVWLKSSGGAGTTTDTCNTDDEKVAWNLQSEFINEELARDAARRGDGGGKKKK